MAFQEPFYSLLLIVVIGSHPLVQSMWTDMNSISSVSMNTEVLYTFPEETLFFKFITFCIKIILGITALTKFSDASVENYIWLVALPSLLQTVFWNYNYLLATSLASTELFQQKIMIFFQDNSENHRWFKITQGTLWSLMFWALMRCTFPLGILRHLDLIFCRWGGVIQGGEEIVFNLL